MPDFERRQDFLPLARPDIGEEEIGAVGDVLRSGWLTTGPEVERFESRMKEYLGCAEVLALNSCTGGLHISLVEMGIGPGDEVILPTLTFAATAHVVHWLGASPVLADVNDNDLTIDIAEIERLYKLGKTRAILPVHFSGYACDMEAINAFAKDKGLRVLEDAAHIIGGRYRSGAMVGTSEVPAVFSFYAIKNMTTAEGGLVASNDSEFVNRLRSLAYFGINKEAFKRYDKKGSWFYEIERNGFKYNMDAIQAALGVVQLTKLDGYNERRRTLARRYMERLAEIDAVVCPAVPLDDSVWHLFIVRLKDGSGISRDELSYHLREMNVGSSVHFIPLHLHPFYAREFSYAEGDFPVAERYYEQCLSLPLYPAMSDEDVDYVCGALKHILATAATE